MNKSNLYKSMIALMLLGSISAVMACDNNHDSLYYSGKYSYEGVSIDYDLGVPRLIVQTVNGHAGFVAIVVPDGELDKPIVYASGYANEFANLAPLYAQAFAPFLAGTGYDFIAFEPLDPSFEIQKNAENLAVFIAEFLDGMVGSEDYELICGGKSAGGLYARTMFVTENSDMGVDKYFSVDTPHKGAIFSNWAEQAGLPDMFFTGIGAKQMHFSTQEYEDFIVNYLEANERMGFLHTILRDVETVAFTRVNNEDNSWTLTAEELAIFGQYHTVSSIIDTTFLQEMGMPVPAMTDFIPFHSSAYLVSDEVKEKNGVYRYKHPKSKYFGSIVPLAGADEYLAHDDSTFTAADIGLIVSTLIN